MLKIKPFRAVLWALPYLVASVASAADLRATLAREAEALKPKLVEMRRECHTHPELSNREEWTSRFIAERLRGLGIPFVSGVAKHGVVATIEGKTRGKILALRADIDALPIEEVNDVPYRSLNKGVKHACGHDAHLTIALGTAELLWKHRAELAGTVHIIFQPAEEGAPPGEKGGAELMLIEGLFDRIKPAAALALHVMPDIEAGGVGFTIGPEMASSDRFQIVVEGKQTHGANPHMGIDPIVAASQIVLALQTIDSRRINPIEPVVVTIGSIHGGSRFNIIPGSVEMWGTMRTLSPEVRKQTRSAVEQIAKMAAETAGAKATVTFDLGIPVTVNDPVLSRFAEQSLRKSLGPANVRQIPPKMIAEDFAFFGERVPSFLFFLGVGNKAKGITAALHSPDFDIDEDALVIGTKAMTGLVVDFLR